MITEITLAERVTAVITSHLDDGDNYDGAIVIGVYPHSQSEIWIEHQGARSNIQVADIPGLIKQLRRAARIAEEQEAT
ncbi:MAG: hypothetical protein GAK30_02985 [Paracidovorax wautersii]|uniref:Uncharacterized protein n=1 Tax=Paracidovorax wautersii TaxID=1177982 RepID=A0A7V8FM13_9BURK|nr:MAG: hypothetical protein GAK30_02985 [Paracidovorax wautersii]